MMNKQSDVTMGNQQVSSESLMPIPSLKGYFMDADANIYSTRRTKFPKMLTKFEHRVSHSKKPYYRARVAGKLWLVHRLALMVYLGRELMGHETGNHISGNTLDNSRRNLEIATHAEQVAHAVQTGLYCSGDEWYVARGLSRERERNLRD